MPLALPFAPITAATLNGFCHNRDNQVTLATARVNHGTPTSTDVTITNEFGAYFTDGLLAGSAGSYTVTFDQPISSADYDVQLLGQTTSVFEHAYVTGKSATGFTLNMHDENLTGIRATVRVLLVVKE